MMAGAYVAISGEFGDLQVDHNQPFTMRINGYWLERCPVAWPLDDAFLMGRVSAALRDSGTVARLFKHAT